MQFQISKLDGSLRPGGYVVSGRYLKGTFALRKAAAKNTSNSKAALQVPVLQISMQQTSAKSMGSACPLCSI